MTQVIIGGAAIDVALPNFKALKAAWRYIAMVQGDVDPMAGVEAILGVVSVGAQLDPKPTVDELEERLKPSEMTGLRLFINDLMIEIGLATPLGEDQPATGAASPSTAISDALSTS
jgi:hypothetical protein